MKKRLILMSLVSLMMVSCGELNTALQPNSLKPLASQSSAQRKEMSLSRPIPQKINQLSSQLKQLGTVKEKVNFKSLISNLQKQHREKGFKSFSPGQLKNLRSFLMHNLRNYQKNNPGIAFQIKSNSGSDGNGPISQSEFQSLFDSIAKDFDLRLEPEFIDALYGAFVVSGEPGTEAVGCFSDFDSDLEGRGEIGDGEHFGQAEFEELGWNEGDWEAMEFGYEGAGHSLSPEVAALYTQYEKDYTAHISKVMPQINQELMGLLSGTQLESKDLKQVLSKYSFRTPDALLEHQAQEIIKMNQMTSPSHLFGSVSEIHMGREIYDDEFGDEASNGLDDETGEKPEIIESFGFEGLSLSATQKIALESVFKSESPNSISNSLTHQKLDAELSKKSPELNIVKGLLKELEGQEGGLPQEILDEVVKVHHILTPAQRQIWAKDHYLLQMTVSEDVFHSEEMSDLDFYKGDCKT